MEEKEVGTITHYYGHVSVVIIELNDSLKVGDTVHIKGHSSDFTQLIDSMEIEHAGVQEAKKGDIIGLKISQKAHVNDKVYKVIE
jgi:putative protease